MKRKVTNVSKASHRRPTKAGKLVTEPSRKTVARSASGGKSVGKSRTSASQKPQKLTAPTSSGRFTLKYAGIIDGLPPDASINHDRYLNAEVSPKAPKRKRVAAGKRKKVTARTEWGRALLEIAGIAEGLPPDASRNLDRYLNAKR